MLLVERVRRAVIMDVESEKVWLRHRVQRLRTILRFVTDVRAEAPLRELIAEAELRLDAL
jgi:hypothetical protein